MFILNKCLPLFLCGVLFSNIFSISTFKGKIPHLRAFISVFRANRPQICLQMKELFKRIFCPDFLKYTAACHIKRQIVFMKTQTAPPPE